MGNAYTWSMGNVKARLDHKGGLGFPFNSFFAFFLLSILCLGVALLSKLTPKRLNKKMVIVDETPTNTITITTGNYRYLK